MPPSSTPSISSYRRESRAIVEAGRELADALDLNASSNRRGAEVSYSLERLKELAAQSTAMMGPRLGFTPFADEAGHETPLTLDDALTLAGSDAMLAQVFYAASAAAGDRAAPTGAEPLREAVQSAELYQVANAPGVQRFVEKADRAPSLSLEEATRLFQIQAKATLDKLLEESAHAVEKIFDALAERSSKIVEGFAEVSKLFDSGAETSVLLRAAWQKLLSALQAIRRIIEPFTGEALDSLSEMVGSASLRGALEKLFASKTLRDDIDAFHAQPPRRPAQVDQHTDELEALEDRFVGMVANIRRVAAVIAVLAPLLTAHVAGPFSVLAVPAAYSLALAAIVLLGIDFTHSGRMNDGKGVRRILDDVQAASQTAGEPGVS